MSWEAFRWTAKSPSELYHVLGPHGVDDLIRQTSPPSGASCPPRARTFDGGRTGRPEVSTATSRSGGGSSSPPRRRSSTTSAPPRRRLPPPGDGPQLDDDAPRRRPGLQDALRIVSQIFERNLANWHDDNATFTGEKPKAGKKKPAVKASTTKKASTKSASKKKAAQSRAPKRATVKKQHSIQCLAPVAPEHLVDDGLDRVEIKPPPLEHAHEPAAAPPSGRASSTSATASRRAPSRRPCCRAPRNVLQRLVRDLALHARLDQLHERPPAAVVLVLGGGQRLGLGEPRVVEVPQPGAGLPAPRPPPRPRTRAASASGAAPRGCAAARRGTPSPGRSTPAGPRRADLPHLLLGQGHPLAQPELRDDVQVAPRTRTARRGRRSAGSPAAFCSVIFVMWASRSERKTARRRSRVVFPFARSS